MLVWWPDVGEVYAGQLAAEAPTGEYFSILYQDGDYEYLHVQEFQPGGRARIITMEHRSTHSHWDTHYGVEHRAVVG